MVRIAGTLRFSKLRHQKGHITAERAGVLAETMGDVTTEGLATKTEIAVPGLFALARMFAKNRDKGPCAGRFFRRPNPCPATVRR